jgi:hypothetical protein
VVESRLLVGVTGLTAGLLGLALALATYATLRPSLDLTALLTPPSLAILVIAYDVAGRLRVDITPLAAAPLAYTLHHIAIVYLREVEAVESLAYSITLGSATTMMLLSLALITRRTR